MKLQLIDKDKNLWVLFNECKQLSEELFEMDYLTKTLKNDLENKDIKINRLQIANDCLKEEIEDLTSYSIELDNKSIDNIKKDLKWSDEYTKQVIIDYLKLDNFEIVKNLAKITNTSNTAEIIAYRDGVIRTNEAMIKILSDSIWKKSFYNRLSGENEFTK